VTSKELSLPFDRLRRFLRCVINHAVDALGLAVPATLLANADKSKAVQFRLWHIASVSAMQRCVRSWK
jgi:hypothetical protein